VPRFAAWVKSRAVGELVSASPELLCETRGRWIHVEPMKGTAPPSQRAWLEASEKDRAELAMITDLLRDDLHRLCAPGSVHVRNERRMIELPYVMQAVADVEGELLAGTTLRDVLSVVHPGGSVTGAPREAAVEILTALESTPRGAYCGALALESRSASRAALLIRTAERVGEAWRYGVGSGITWDSDPRAELDEVRLKLGALG
jgi:para-aminobenzoate synthetase/4-amino-4-deoxychorismate lyase